MIGMTLRPSMKSRSKVFASSSNFLFKREESATAFHASPLSSSLSPHVIAYKNAYIQTFFRVAMYLNDTPWLRFLHNIQDYLIGFDKSVFVIILIRYESQGDKVVLAWVCMFSEKGPTGSTMSDLNQKIFPCLSTNHLQKYH